MALTPRQRAVIETAMEPGLNRDIVTVCAAAGVPRRTFYNWLDDDEFRQAWESVWQAAIRRQLAGVVAAMVNRALAGDVPAARLVGDLAGVIKTKHEVAGKNGQPLIHTVVIERAPQ